MQSFLGSLNYYGRFIEDYAIYASILYELREADFHGWRCRLESKDEVKTTEEEDEKWSRVQVSFAMLKNKIATAPILRHFDPAKEAVIIVYASEWAISASLVQDQDGLLMPVMFTSRTLKSNELNYSTVEKEVLALLRILETRYTMLVTRPLKVLTRHSTLTWLVRSTGLKGCLGNWAALLSQWTLEIVKCKKGEDQVLGALAASITFRENVDSILSSIAPKKQARQVVGLPTPTVEPEEELYVMSFDGSARVKQGGGACSAIVWRLPTWTIVKAASKYLATSTVNEAEYEGMLLGFDLLELLERRRLIICVDSNLIVRQMLGEIECKASGLSPLRAKALNKLQSWSSHGILHVKRDWNQSADQLASAALHQQKGTAVVSKEEWPGLEAINRLSELLVPRDQSPSVKIFAMTRSRSPIRIPGEVIQEDVIQQLRVDRIRKAQDEETWVRDLKSYLKGD